MARHKSNRKSCLSHVLRAACAFGAAAIIHYGSNVRHHVFALASVTSIESAEGRDRVPSSPRNDELHPFPVDRSLRLKRQDKDASRVARKPKEKNVIDDKEGVNTVERALDSSLNVDQTRKLKRKKTRTPKGSEKDQSSGGTSSGDAEKNNGANRNGRNKHDTKIGGTSNGKTSMNGGVRDQSSSGTPPGVTKKKNGANRDATKGGRKKNRFGDGAMSDASTTRGNNKVNRMNARKKPQKMNEVTKLDSVMNTGTASPHSANSNAADSFLTTFSDAKKRGGNKQKRVKKKNTVGSAGYDTPGIYAQSSTSSWGSSGKDVFYHSGNAEMESGGKGGVSEEPGDESESVWNSDGWEESAWNQAGWEESVWKPAGWTEVPHEVLYDYKNACPCVYVDAPSWGSPWGGISAWAGATPGTGAGSTSGTGVGSTSGTGAVATPGTGAGSTSGTGVGSTSGTGAVATPGTGAGSTWGTGVGSTSGTGAVATPWGAGGSGSKLKTKSSKKAKSNNRKLQWGGVQHKPERIKVCTCVPSYFPTYFPTHNPTEEPTKEPT
jgi:hypothetical protein